VKILVIEPHNRCNCRCVMCDIWKRTDAREISPGELARHIDDIVSLGVEHVVFTGGEPLMHSDLFRLAAPLRARGIRMTLLSTGLLLAHYATRIVDSIDEVIVSLDGPREVHDAIRRVPGAFDRLVEGVRAIHHASARCTVQARNAAHLRATVAAARAIGLRSISFLAADLDSTAFDRPVAWPESRKAAVAPDLPALEREMECLIAEYPADGFILEPPWKLRRIVSHFRAHRGLEPHTAPRCNAPWVSAVWEANGDVRPCFFHAPIGNTANGTLAQIVNGPAAVEFRENLNVAENPVCQRCVCSLFL
jgi:MoaA/NifB/PqqE/SkfB family radical SAM enzyme